MQGNDILIGEQTKIIFSIYKNMANKDDELMKIKKLKESDKS